MVPVPIDIEVDEDTGTWRVLFEFSSARAENTTLNPDQSRWLSVFFLDYTETPLNALKFNATDWESATNTTGYQDTDNAVAMDLESERRSYFVCRSAINQSHCGDAGVLFGNRTRCHFTMTGDLLDSETIDNVCIYGDNTSYDIGGGIISCNVSSDDCIYINYYIDDNVNGYAIADDGSLSWNITVMARF